jgi:hypothetical protein
VGDVGASIAASKNAVENNNLGYRFFQLNMKYERCQDDSCREQVRQEQDELHQKSINGLKQIGGLLADFTPVVSDVKAFYEAETAEDYIIATIGILPPAKLIKLAKKALKAGDVTLAKKLIKEAEDLASSAKNESSNFTEVAKTSNNVAKTSMGSTGRNAPVNLNEKLALEQAISNPTAGRQLPVPMTDKRWPAADGWVKMSQNINGIEIHYVRNTKTGAVDDFKFK